MEPKRVPIMLGIAATEASGLARNFGTDTKPFHAGIAAQGGVQSALLAREGFGANAEAVGDFIRIHSGPGEAQTLEVLGTLGKVWDIVAPGLSIKKDPCCRFGHLPLDATFMLLAKERFAAADVETFTIRIQPGADTALIYKQPDTGLEGKFSMEYALGAALLDGGVTLASFTEPWSGGRKCARSCSACAPNINPSPAPKPSRARRAASTARLRASCAATLPTRCPATSCCRNAISVSTASSRRSASIAWSMRWIVWNNCRISACSASCCGRPEGRYCA